jgi:hypothetical protein
MCDRVIRLLGILPYMIVEEFWHSILIIVIMILDIIFHKNT